MCIRDSSGTFMLGWRNVADLSVRADEHGCKSDPSQVAKAVSYTHLDVYKRQPRLRVKNACPIAAKIVLPTPFSVNLVKSGIR